MANKVSKRNEDKLIDSMRKDLSKLWETTDKSNWSALSSDTIIKLEGGNIVDLSPTELQYVLAFAQKNQLPKTESTNKTQLDKPKPVKNTIANNIGKPYSAPEGKTRVTFIIKEVTVEKVKAIAVTEGRFIGDLVNDTLEEFITNYEKDHGEVKTLPPKRKKK